MRSIQTGVLIAAAAAVALLPLVCEGWQQGSRRLVPMETKERRRVALVIGNSKYPGRELKNPQNDAADMKAALEKTGFEVRLGIDLTRAAMEQHISEFIGGVHDGDIALFYFAGHGMQIDGENLLVPVDFADPPAVRVKESCVRFDAVQNRLEQSPARLTLMVMDACRNNPYAHSSRSWSRGLAPVEAGLGMYVAFAASPGQTAGDNPKGRNGLFTKYVLEQLRQPVPLSQLFRNVRESVHEVSDTKQTPYILDQMLGDFFFIPPASLRQQTPAGEVPQHAPAGSDQLLQQGLRLYGQKKCSEAVPLFERAIRADPENPDAHNAAGMAYVCLGTPAPALERFNMAIQLKPDLAGAYSNRGALYMSTGKYKLAIQDFDWAIQEQPDTAVNYAKRARAHFGLRKFEEALADFSKSIDLNPADADAFFGRGKVYQEIAKYREAADDYSAALERKPEFPDAKRALEEIRSRVPARIFKASKTKAESRKASKIAGNRP